MPRMTGQGKRTIAESPKRKAALSESRWVARRLYLILKKVMDELPADRDDLEAWDPELAEYLTREERPAKWLTNGVTDEAG